MERKSLFQEELEPTAEDCANILREIQCLKKEIIENLERDSPLQDEGGPSSAHLEEYAKRCREFKSFLVEIKGKMEEKLPLGDAEGPSTSKAHSEVSAEQLEEIQEGDSVMEDQYKELHGRIMEGDVESVQRLLQDVKPGLPLCFEGISALKRSFTCKQVVMSTFLIRFGVTFKDDEEGEDLDISEEDVDLINIRLWYFNRDVEESCIYKLMVHSKLAFQGDKNSNDALLCMYKELFQSECIRYLMMVLEKEPPHIVYDFGSKNIDRIYFEAETGLSGITVPSTNSIYIGAEELLSDTAEERAKVKGVVAEEFCHLALQYLFENGSKPYRAKEENSDKVRTFKDLTHTLESDAENEGNLPPIIKDLFIGGVYEADVFECELIARVPHLMGIHGEKEIRDTFQNSSKLTKLIKFYDDDVIPACKSFSDPLYYSRPMMDSQSLHNEKGYILPNEKISITFRDSVNSFEEHLVDYEGIKVLYTNITKLSALQMYHNLKERIMYHVDKVCLFFTLDTFEEIKDLLKQYKSELIQYLVLIGEKIQTESIRKALDSYIVGDNNPKVIIISQSECLNSEGIHYKWDDVPFEFKELFLKRSFLFKGKKCCFSDDLGVQDLTKAFEDDIATFNILTNSSELLRLDDGADLFSQHYNHDTYVDRKFQAMTVDKNIFKDFQRHNAFIFLSGLKKCEVQELPFDEGVVQWLQGSQDEIQSDKSIFIVNKDAEMSFEEFRERNPNKTSICLHYYEEEFYLKVINSSGDFNDFSGHKKKKTLTEEEMLNFLKSERTVIISDNAGYGKSTVISNLIDNVERKYFRSLNWRINFSKFSGKKTDPLSIAHIENNSSDEEVLNHLFLILGLKNGLEKELFRKFSKEGHCFVYFDGFDEIPSEYVSNALRLLSTVRKQTAVNMVISTRKHHEKELERQLSTFSHELVPLSREEQVLYLEKLWKSKLKDPNGRGKPAGQNDKNKVEKKIKDILKQSQGGKTKLDKELFELIISLEKIELGEDLVKVRSNIDDLKFRKLAETVIDKSSLDKETLEFMGIPLHLFMIGTIYFNGNFNVEIHSDIYSIYSAFIEQKLLIFLEEKQGWICAGPLKERTLRSEINNAYRIHIDLANQLIDEGKIDSRMSEDDLDLCASLGVVCISGAVINFLHHTFAEFFKAEFVRLSLDKKGFIGVLFDEKFDVVRKFLASALEKKNFENLTKEFFEDVDFLFPVLIQIVDKSEFIHYGGRDYQLHSHLCSVMKIVKSLLETFEKTVDPDLPKKFALKLEAELCLAENWYRIGGCLTFKMLKMLLKRNFKDNLKMMFGVVRYYSNHEEVIQVLSECISIQTAGKCGRKKGKQGDNKKAGCILKLLQIRDPAENGLLFYAIWNARKEVIANILKFSKDILGKEQFISAIVQSEDYGRVMNEFIYDSNFDRICALLKSFRTSFDDEIDILFDTNLKFKILESTQTIYYELRNMFAEAINLFIEYFGIEKVKEILLSHDSDGKYLIHILVHRNIYAIENLNIIKNILDDNNKMKQFIKYKDRELNSMLVFAIRNYYISFCDILQFCTENLQKSEIKEMLIGANKVGENALHSLFIHNQSNTIITISNLIKDTLSDNELVRQLLKCKIGSTNIFHIAIEPRNNNFGDILQFCSSYLDKNEIKDMLISLQDTGSNVLHFLFEYNSCEMLIENICLIKDTLADDEWFKQFLKSEDGDLKNLFHCAAWNEDLINFSFLNLHLDKNEIKELLIATDERGQTCLHYGTCSTSRYLLDLLDYSYEMLKFDKSGFEELILQVDYFQGNTFLHLLVKYHMDEEEEKLIDSVSKVLESLKGKLSAVVLNKLIRIRNHYGRMYLQMERDFPAYTD